MFTRKVVTVSAAAIAAVALSVPLVQAQAGSADAGSPSVGSLSAGSLGAGDEQGGSLASAAGGEGGSAGSLDSASGEGGGSAASEDSSLSDLTPTTAPAESCELPDLGGSVAKFYPLFGLTDLPSGVMDMITSALDSFPNVLDMVAGDGSALLGQAGSLTDPLCNTIFGGEMTTAPQPPVTVIVDGEGNPVTTVTGTVGAAAASADTVTTTLSAEAVADDVARAHDVNGAEGVQGKASVGVLPTSVPAPSDPSVEAVTAVN